MGRAGWLEGVAVIRESDRVGHESADQGEPWPWEIHLNRFGTNKYDFTLQVTVPGAEPYLVADRFRVPKKAENLGFFNVGNKIPAGVEVPVRVDPRDAPRIEIEWERWLDLARPQGRVSRAGEASADASRRCAPTSTRTRSCRRRMRANNKSAARAWVEAVRLGHLTREQFEHQLTIEVDHGRMDPADAEAARAALDG